MTKYKHFTFKQRQILEEMLREGIRKEDIADRLGCSRATIYNQIKFGEVDGVYQAEYSQGRYDQMLKTKGRKEILSKDARLCEYIAECILSKGYSSRQIISEINSGKTEFPVDVIKSINTIYAALDKGFIPGCTRETFAYRNAATIFHNGCIIIPKQIREALNWQDGMQLKVSIDGDKVMLTKDDG